MSANSVSPPPSADAGGTATACSMPSTTGTGMYDASVCHSRLPRLSSRRLSSRARTRLSSSRFEMSPICGIASRRLPPWSARRGRSPGAEPGSEVAQLRIAQALIVKHQHRVAIDGVPDGVDGRASIGWLRSMPPTSAANSRMQSAKLDGHGRPPHPERLHHGTQEAAKGHRRLR